MTGGQGVAPVSTSKEPTPAEAEYLRSKSLDGGTANVQDLRESASRGSSLTEWREAQKGKAS